MPGVFGGPVSSAIRASSATMRASCIAILSTASVRRANNAAISASFSVWLSASRSAGGVTRWLESTRAYRCQVGSEVRRLATVKPAGNCGGGELPR